MIINISITCDKENIVNIACDKHDKVYNTLLRPGSERGCRICCAALGRVSPVINMIMFVLHYHGLVSG